MHDSLDGLFNKLWDQYVSTSPVVKSIHDLIESKGNNIANDHVAFRTFNLPKLGIENLAVEFKKYGYIEKGTYAFEQKKLNAKHFEHTDPSKPKVFISELLVEEFSPALQDFVASLAEQVSDEQMASPQLSYSGRPWAAISHAEYLKLIEESEFAAWLSAFGFCANHFTVFINELATFNEIEDLNNFLKSNSHPLNASGGEVKGSPEVLLEQSSTMADVQEIAFSDGVFRVPTVYYEFAKRYKDAQGLLYQGFVAQSADKIFESTNKIT